MESVAGLHIICLLGVWLSCGTKVLKLLQKLPRSCFDVWWEVLWWEAREDQKEEVQRQLWGTAGWWMTSPWHNRFMKMSEKYILLNSRNALLKSEEEKIQFSWVKKGVSTWDVKGGGEMADLPLTLPKLGSVSKVWSQQFLFVQVHVYCVVTIRLNVKKLRSYFLNHDFVGVFQYVLGPPKHVLHLVWNVYVISTAV